MSHSPKGWTDTKLCKDWIKTVFDPLTKDKANGRIRVLLMDGHNSHFTPEIIAYAMECNIKIIGYPPHCTHVLQGLDVVCFAKLKSELKDAIQKFEETKNCTVGKTEFMGVFCEAFPKAFDRETVKAVFQATGIYPFDRDAIKPEQMRPAEATATKSSFALTFTSPVKAIMTSFRTYKPT